MFNKKDLQCGIANAVVRVWCQDVPGVKGKKETRFIRCEHSSHCARTAFCRFVNPLTTRVPFDPAAVAAAPCLPPTPVQRPARPAAAAAAVAVAPAAAPRPASASTRMPPVMDRPASS